MIPFSVDPSQLRAILETARALTAELRRFNDLMSGSGKGAGRLTDRPQDAAGVDGSTPAGSR